MTKGLFAVDQRKIRIDTVIDALKESRKTLDFIIHKKFVWEIQQKWGLTEQKAKEYIQLAMDITGASISKDGEIIFNKDGIV